MDECVQIAFGSFGAYLLIDSHRVITPEIAFVSLSIFNIMRWPLIELPAMGAFVVQV